MRTGRADRVRSRAGYSQAMTLPPTGSQYEIISGGHRAVVTEVGATLRRYTLNGREVVHGFAADETVKGGRGQNMIPWPNRLRDGKYTFDGVDQQLWLTEPARHNASHGLVRYAPWRVLDHQPDRVTLGFVLYPQPGWPGTLRAELTYRVGEDGLTVRVQVENVGSVAVPFGYGAHPYLSVGEEAVDEVRLTVPAGTFLRVDDRLLPTSVADVTGTALDYRAGAELGDASLDTAFTDLARGSDGRWRVRLGRAERSAELWADESFHWTQVFTGGPHRTWGTAVEPMTCGPDAFNAGPTHADLITLAPGATFAGSWGVVGG